MSDNSNQLGTDTIATDDITGGGVANGAKVQRMKAGFGSDNNYADVEASNPLPVVGVGSRESSGTLAALNAFVEIDVSGMQGSIYTITSGFTGTLRADCAIGSGGYAGGLRLQDFFNDVLTTSQVIVGGATLRAVPIPAGATKIRIIAIAYTSGSATLTLTASTAAGTVNSSVGAVQTSAGLPLAGTRVMVKVVSSPTAQTAGQGGDLQQMADGTGLLVNANSVTGQDPVDSAYSGNPIGISYIASDAIPTAVSANGDVQRPWSTKSGATVFAAYVETTPATRTNATTSHASMDTAGNLRTNDSTNTVGSVTGSIGALNAFVGLELNGYEGASVAFGAGFTGTVTLQVGVLGSAELSGRFHNPVDESLTTSIVFTGSAGGRSIQLPPGAARVRIICSVYTSGSMSVTLVGSKSKGNIALFGAPVAGVLPPTVAVMGVYDGSAVRAMKGDSAGVVQVGDNGSSLSMDDGGGSITVDGTVTSNQGTANTAANAWPMRITDLTNFMPTMDVATRAAFMKLTDGTTTPKVLPGSTPAASTDPALLVDIRTPLSISGVTDSTGTGTLNALSANATIAVAGYSGVGFQLAAGTLIGTIVPEISYDNGTTYVATQFDDPATGTKSTSQAYASSNTALSRSIVVPAGASHARVRCSAFTSGTASVSIRATVVSSTFLPTVKPASTIAVTTDSSLVTTPHPSGTQNTTTADTVGTGVALTSTATAAIVAAAGRYSVSVNIPSGTLIATLVAEASVDGGTTYPIQTYFDTASGKVLTLSSTSGVAQFASIIGVGGATHYRVRPSAFTSGTATATLRATCVYDPSVLFASTPGQAPGPTVAVMGGKAETTASTPTNGTVATVSIDLANNVRVAATGQEVHDATMTTRGVGIGGSASANPPTAVSADGDFVQASYDRQGRARVLPIADIVATTGTIALAALNDQFQLDVSAHGGCVLALDTGTLIGTLSVQCWDGIHWIQTFIYDPSSLTSGLAVNSLTLTGAAASQAWGVAVPQGAQFIRIIVTVYTSGAASARLTAAKAGINFYNLFSGKSGGAFPQAVSALGGQVQASQPTAATDGTLQAAAVDSQARQLVSHIDPARQVWKFLGVTSAQTGVNIWVPASGKKIAITHIKVSTYGTTAGRVILWFDVTGTTVFAAQQVAFVGSFAPSATQNPIEILQPAVPIFCNNANYCLKITTATALSVDITVYGYEYN